MRRLANAAMGDAGIAVVLVLMLIILHATARRPPPFDKNGVTFPLMLLCKPFKGGVTRERQVQSEGMCKSSGSGGA